MTFGFAREEGFPTHYEEQHTAAHTDVLLSGIICAIIILAFSLLVILPGFSGWQGKLKLFINVCVATFVGGVIIAGNYGHNWEVGKASISSPYKAATSEEIRGEIGINIALRGINITLKGNARNPDGQLASEIIDYNENFSWEWSQGRFGFGYYAGRVSKDFRAAVLRGVPLPILQLAEYFTFDGEGLRFGRYYRWAGWYSHLLLWAAFPCWIISLILFQTVVSNAAKMMTLTGILQLLAITIWTTLRNPLEVNVPFESEDQTGEIMLSTKYGLDYYLVLGNALFCIIGGVSIFLINLRHPESLCLYFDIDVQTLFRMVGSTREEIEDEMRAMSQKNVNDPEYHVVPPAAIDEGEIIFRRQRVGSYYGKRVYSQKIRTPSYKLAIRCTQHKTLPLRTNLLVNESSM